MTTALTIITDALSELGIIGATEDVPTEYSAPALRKLNQVLETLSLSRLKVPATTVIQIPQANASSYTVGPTGDVSASRPIRVIKATSIGAGNIQYPCEIYTQSQWDALSLKDVYAAHPEVIWYEATPISGTVHVFPRSTGYTLILDCLTLLDRFTSLNDSAVISEGYDKFLTLSLADAMAASYGMQSSPDTLRRLEAVRRAIKRVNYESPIQLADGNTRERYRILRGY